MSLPQQPPIAVLASIGGSPAPILHVLGQHQPAHVWYFCSPESRKTAESIQAQLAWKPSFRVLETNQPEELGPCYRLLRQDIPDLLTEYRISPHEVLVVCTACTEDKATPELLRELLDNALRTAGQHRYEDAAARLYRAMEMQGQLWLEESTEGRFRNGKCKAASLDRLPEALKSLPFFQPDDEGAIKFSLEQIFRALAELDHSGAREIVADLEARDAEGKPTSQWRNATAARNASILAHGTQAISQQGFEQLRSVATQFLGLDLDQEAHPFPTFNPAWLAG